MPNQWKSRPMPGTGQLDKIREVMAREARPLSIQEIVRLLDEDGWQWTSPEKVNVVTVGLLRAKDFARVAWNKYIWLPFDYDTEVLESCRTVNIDENFVNARPDLPEIRRKRLVERAERRTIERAQRQREWEKIHGA